MMGLCRQRRKERYDVVVGGMRQEDLDCARVRGIVGTAVAMPADMRWSYYN